MFLENAFTATLIFELSGRPFSHKNEGRHSSLLSATLLVGWHPKYLSLRKPRHECVERVLVLEDVAVLKCRAVSMTAIVFGVVCMIFEVGCCDIA